MMWTAISLLLAMAPPAPATDEPPREPLRTTEAIRALSADEMRRMLPVSLTGQVVARRHSGGFVIADATGGYVFDGISKPHLEVGDLITLKGKTFLQAFYHQTYIRYCTATITGHAPPPPPRLTEVARIASGAENYNIVSVRGSISEVVKDENHSDWHWMVLRDHAQNFLYVSVPDAGSATPTLLDLVDADVEITGVALQDYTADRRFLGPHLETWGRDCIRVTTPRPDDPFTAPCLPEIYHSSPQALAQMRRRRIVGHVLAAWRGNRLLAKEDSNRLIEVDLAKGQALPPVGARVEAVGFPGTDLFRISLSRALCRTIAAPRTAPDTNATPVSSSQIVSNRESHRLLKQAFHGQTIRLRGIVRSLPAPDSADGRLNLDCDGYLVPVDVTATRAATKGLVIGCLIDVTGVCVMETDKWSPSNLFPVFGGFTLVPRTPTDIHVLTRPSWWTPLRLLVVICSLLIVLVAVFVWNRILARLVERRGKQLLREQVAHVRAALKIGERTRLAVELHDSLSQNLAGLACQVAAAKSALDLRPTEAARHLDTAEKMLLSSRTELRRCLWDLRGDTLEIADMTEAVRKTVRPVVGKATLHVHFDVPRAELDDSTVHSILCIIRELAANAVRHGHASQIHVVGNCADGQIAFSVQDNGCGFDTGRSPGLAEGHFGLAGIRERIGRLDGSFALASDASGTTARVTIALPHATRTDKT